VLQLRFSVPLTSCQPEASTYVQLAPAAIVTPAVQPPLVPARLGLGTTQPTCCNSGAPVVKPPAEHVRFNAPLTRFHPLSLVYVQLAPDLMDEPATHVPAEVPAGAVDGSTQASAVQVGAEPDHTPFVHVREPVLAVSV